MAKQCLIEKQKQQAKAWTRLNAELEAIHNLPKEKQAEALAEFDKRRIKNRMYKSRKYNRCAITGRPRGYIRFFGVCRQVFRELAHEGKLPGVKKASW